ncbi:hypothetical protein TWF694_003196 [Orbilia ellipsospora]|uniref:Carrier domain-containing protein n=1 Tax=Orbilia ellipsospora TaxID=2528407 RepID=A0AAV9X0W3_9PEZI
MPIQNLFSLLNQAAEKGSGTGILAHRSGGGSDSSFLTYEQLLELAKKKLVQLQRLENIAGRLVLIYLADQLDSIVWFWSIVAGGGVPCICPPLPKDLSSRQARVVHLRDLLEAPLILSDESLLSEFSGIEDIRLLSTNDIESVALENPSREHEFKGISKSEEDLAVLMLTSGSTNNPKAVCLKNGQILASLWGKSAQHGTSRNDVFLNWIGLDHVANLTQIHLHAMSLAAQQVHVPGTELLAHPLRYIEHITNHKVTYTFAPNFFLATLVRCLESSLQRDPSQHNFDLSSLRILGSGGETNVVDTCAKLTEMLGQFGAPKSFISPGFGMTETCAGSIHSPLDCPSYDLAQNAEFCSVGEPMPGFKMRIVRSDGTNAGLDEAGALEVSGPAVFSGYYNNLSASHAAFTPDGWFKTGDRGLVDINGRLRLTGRDKDEVVINGINHSCQAIEIAIERARIPEVTPSFTVVWPYRPRNSSTETLCVAYLPSSPNGDAQSRATAAATVSKTVIKYCGARPFKIFALPQYLLEKSALGKLSRAKIQQAFEDGSYSEFENDNKKANTGSTGDNNGGAKTETEKVILQVFHDLLGSYDGQIEVEVRIDSDIFEIGVSSIDVLRLRVYLQKAFNIEIPVMIFFSHPILRDLGRAIDDLQVKKDYDPITVLQPNGNKTPVFLIHPGLGEILIFLNLARYFEDRPVYALRARGFDGEEYFSSMEEMVHAYHDAIKRVQPKGPYAVIGYSYGSILGFEITKLMETNNDRVQFLSTIDQPPHFKWWARLADWCYGALTISYYMGLFELEYRDHILPTLKEKTRDEILDHIVEVAGPRMKDVGFSREHLGNWATLAYEMKIISQNYDPTGRVACMDVFHIDYSTVRPGDDEWPVDDMMKWKDFSEDSRVHMVQGRHLTLIKPPHVFGLYKQLKKAIEDRGL